MPDANILVVDDEDSIRHFVSRSLKDDGLVLLDAFKRQSPETIVIVITAFGETETAVRAMSLGAFYFLKKPL